MGDLQIVFPDWAWADGLGARLLERVLDLDTSWLANHELEKHTTSTVHKENTAIQRAVTNKNRNKICRGDRLAKKLEDGMLPPLAGSYLAWEQDIANFVLQDDPQDPTHPLPVPDPLEEAPLRYYLKSELTVSLELKTLVSTPPLDAEPVAMYTRLTPTSEPTLITCRPTKRTAPTSQAPHDSSPVVSAKRKGRPRPRIVFKSPTTPSEESTPPSSMLPTQSDATKLPCIVFKSPIASPLACIKNLPSMTRDVPTLPLSAPLPVASSPSTLPATSALSVPSILSHANVVSSHTNVAPRQAKPKAKPCKSSNTKPRKSSNTHQTVSAPFQAKAEQVFVDVSLSSTMTDPVLSKSCPKPCPVTKPVTVPSNTDNKDVLCNH
ncbi:hypothetical protein BC835DRAFT_1423206 [Cytidiella melzeri]|nr:hypothetical protein BC835DRAFT_1423206 [Cytidiella melzeri]